MLFNLVKLDASHRFLGKKAIFEVHLKEIYTPNQIETLLQGGELSIDDETYVRLEAIPSEENTTQQILEQRQSQYGDYADVARITQEIKKSLQSGASYASLSDGQKLALDMIANKMARAVNGDVTYQDNYEDICGYSQLVLDELKNK